MACLGLSLIPKSSCNLLTSNFVKVHPPVKADIDVTFEGQKPPSKRFQVCHVPENRTDNLKTTGLWLRLILAPTEVRHLKSRSPVAKYRSCRDAIGTRSEKFKMLAVATEALSVSLSISGGQTCDLIHRDF